MTKEHPQVRGGRELWVRGLPTGDDFPDFGKFTYYLEHDGRKSVASMQTMNDDVSNREEGTVGPANLQVRSGNVFADVHEPVLLVVMWEDTNGRGYSLRQERWIRADLFKDEPEELGPGPETESTFHVLHNEYLEVRLDKRWGGAINGLYLAGDERNYVDSHDNGRLIQVDCSDGSKCANWDKNPWTDIPHRDLLSATQGGSTWREPNWPLEVLTETDTLFHCRTRLADYWGVGPNGERKTQWTEYILDWQVRLSGKKLSLYANVEGGVRPKTATIWWFAKGFKEFSPTHRWESNPAFDAKEDIGVGIATDGTWDKWVAISSDSGRALAHWLMDAEGNCANVDEAPEGAISAECGIRDWNTREVSMELDFSDVIDGAEPEPEPIPEPILEVDYAKENNVILRALLREFGEEGLKLYDKDRFARFYEQEKS